MKIAPIETPRLLLRGFRAEDAPFAMGIWNDPEMGEYLPDESAEGMTEAARQAYLTMLEGLGDDPDCCYLISEDKHRGTRIGTCSFIPSQDGSSYDIAYCVHKSFWGRGYATEMAQGMVDYARSQGAKKVTVLVGSENAPSNAVVKKLGFQRTGEGTYEKRGTGLVRTDYHYELVLRTDP